MSDVEIYKNEQEDFWDKVDRSYESFKDDMLTESYEDNCSFYGKAAVDNYLKTREEVES